MWSLKMGHPLHIMYIITLSTYTIHIGNLFHEVSKEHSPHKRSIGILHNYNYVWEYIIM